MWRWFQRQVERHRQRYGRLAALALVGTLALAFFDWWQRLAFAWQTRRGIGKVFAAMLNAVLSPWFYWPVVFLAASLLVWLYFSGQRRLSILESAVEKQEQQGGTVFPPAIVQSLDTYHADATYRDGVWWLMLTRTQEDSAGFRVFVTDPVGGTARKVFAQGGKTITVHYPDDFEAPGLGGTKQPWGRYTVRWEVHLLTEDKTAATLDGTADASFDWQPFGGSS